MVMWSIFTWRVVLEVVVVMEVDATVVIGATVVVEVMTIGALYSGAGGMMFTAVNTPSSEAIVNMRVCI